MGRLALIAPIALLLAGCLQRTPIDRRYPDVDLEPPVIETIELACDADRGRWAMTLKASAWTGGAASAWTIDGEYVEIHTMARKSWQTDGTGETLEMTLTIADDFRDVGGGTVFTCSTDPNGVLVLYDTENNPSDCRAWGPEPRIFEDIEDTPTCDILTQWR